VLRISVLSVSTPPFGFVFSTKFCAQPCTLAWLPCQNGTDTDKMLSSLSF